MLQPERRALLGQFEIHSSYFPFNKKSTYRKNERTAKTAKNAINPPQNHGIHFFFSSASSGRLTFTILTGCSISRRQ